MDTERLRRLLADERRSAMVGWFDLPVLARSGVLVAIANLFGRHSDRRLIEALANQPQAIFDYSQEAGDFWVDYVSDLGDGWNSTYAIAHALAQPMLELQSAAAASTVEITRGGRVLIFGGDVVYPYPSREAYEQRTEKPYAMALAGNPRCPDVFAVPGNHDWYDSLIAFSRTFCRPERGFGGCRTQQTRSYFALRLPQRWWLLAIDLQLGADLDEPQVQYFQRVAAAMEDDARIVLCVPEPQWLLKEAYPADASYEDDALRFLEHKILKRLVQVFLTGDLHHYRRHENPAGVQKIVDGGGGAFVHPTHVPHEKTLSGGFTERAAYPSRAKSWRLAWRNLMFPFLNPRFFWLPATLYALSAWFTSASLGPQDLETVQLALIASIGAAVRDPFDGLWLLAVIAAFVFFTDTHVKWY
ncbi:MAG: metallophosphoesterase family protein, partial [Steroidobacteraceae bacterium]